MYLRDLQGIELKKSLEHAAVSVRQRVQSRNGMIKTRPTRGCSRAPDGPTRSGRRGGSFGCELGVGRRKKRAEKRKVGDGRRKPEARHGTVVQIIAHH